MKYDSIFDVVGRIIVGPSSSHTAGACKMGLICDPVAGLSISPCIKRNAIGVMNAFLAAELALSGVASIIPPDEVIDSLMYVGRDLPASLKETGQGGIAKSPTGKKIKKELYG